MWSVSVCLWINRDTSYLNKRHKWGNPITSEPDIEVQQKAIYLCRKQYSECVHVRVWWKKKKAHTLQIKSRAASSVGKWSLGGSVALETLVQDVAPHNLVLICSQQSEGEDAYPNGRDNWGWTNKHNQSPIRDALWEITLCLKKPVFICCVHVKAQERASSSSTQEAHRSDGCLCPTPHVVYIFIRFALEMWSNTTHHPLWGEADSPAHPDSSRTRGFRTTCTKFIHNGTHWTPVINIQRLWMILQSPLRDIKLKIKGK